VRSLNSALLGGGTEAASWRSGGAERYLATNSGAEGYQGGGGAEPVSATS